MKTNKILLSVALAALAIIVATPTVKAQNDATGIEKPLIGTLRLEARADFQYTDHTYALNDSTWGSSPYGFRGKYFNLHMGGHIGDKFSYYFRQRIRANAGDVRFFDNTDFLYLNYQANPNWGLRFGKDALAVGGFEYDLPPIDVMFFGYYWDNYYCFQNAASVAFTTNDGNHTFRAQVAMSPYCYTGSPYGETNMLSYNILWSGNMGHWQTLWSVSLFDGGNRFMQNIVLGNKLEYERFNIYLDLIYRNTGSMDLACYSAIAEAQYKLCGTWTLFAKGSYVNNQQHDGSDCLSQPGQKEIYGGMGCYFRPIPSVRLHAFAAYYNNTWATSVNSGMGNDNRTARDLGCNIGVTWNIDALKILQQHK